MTTVEYRPAYRVLAKQVDGTPLDALALGPTRWTQSRLSDLGLVYKQEPGGFVLYAQYVGGTDGVRRVPVARATTLVFGITQNGEFPSKFEPKLTPATGPNLYLTNRTAATTARSSGQLTRAALAGPADGCRIVARRFLAAVDVAGALPPATLAVATLFAPVRALPDVPIPTGAGEAQVPVDLTTAPERAFTLAPTPPGTPRSCIVADDELAGRGAFGVLDLVLEPTSGPDPVAGNPFTARFQRQ